MLSPEMFAPCFKADVCEALTPKGKGVLAWRHLLFLGS